MDEIAQGLLSKLQVLRGFSERPGIAWVGGRRAASGEGGGGRTVLIIAPGTSSYRAL